MRQAIEPDYRYPFPPYPTGWYLLTDSRSLAPGEVRPLRYFGQDLVLFRSMAGTPVLFDAHCPHMGAHLGYGGLVDGECIRCPFHSWKFDSEGRCAEVGYGTTTHCLGLGSTRGRFMRQAG